MQRRMSTTPLSISPVLLFFSLSLSLRLMECRGLLAVECACCAVLCTSSRSRARSSDEHRHRQPVSSPTHTRSRHV